ncbi:WD repeat-containing protein 19-like [Planoprotostelium fungivorum]|uniref:WD repeat-containing protein 19-like n=1 Tax=Planoprotostelium fungivorum TaxID=1890364 RepID=A0A2P6NWP5_9EUKA|nr:WD repeat-containing protein 19-like [Planoprotostelium fungivorum]
MATDGGSSKKKNKNPEGGMKKDLFTIGPKINGAGSVLFSWQPDGNLLAAVGTNKVVHIFDRNGETIDSIPLQSACCGIDWDRDGELLSLLQTGSSAITFWDRNNRKTSQLDTGMKEGLSFMSWSKNGPHLVVGSHKGSIVFYNKRTQRKIPLTGGLHAKRICSGAWNSKNFVTLGSEDRQITVYNTEGELIDHTLVKSEPLDMLFSEMKADKKATKQENTISVNLGRKTIYLYNLADKENPIELAFQPKYGTIISYKWFGDGYMMLGFSEGYFVVISTHSKEIGQELFSSQFFTGSLTDICFSPTLQKTAICGDSIVKVVNVSSWKTITDTFTLDIEVGACEQLGWTQDGLILTVATTNGHLFSFLTKTPLITAHYDSKFARLSSLRSITLSDAANPAVQDITLDIDIEPHIIGLGPNHIVVGRNNYLWFYSLNAEGQKNLVAEKQYIGTVSSIMLTEDYVAVLVEGKIQLHSLNFSQPESESQSKIFPDRDDAPVITCFALTKEFLIYGTNNGHIYYFYMQEWSNVSEFRHSGGVPIKKLYANGNGTRVIFLDSAGEGFLFSPVQDLVIRIPEWSPNVTRVMWDAADWGSFVAAENNCQRLYTYVYLPSVMDNVPVLQIGNHKQTTKYTPIMVYNGSVVVLAENGSINKIVMPTHDSIGPISSLSPEKSKKCFFQTLALNRLRDCWDIALKLKDPECWAALSREALKQLDTELAFNVYRQLGDPAMVLALQSLMSIEERNLLAGHVALLLKEYAIAEQMFIGSSRNITALEMRRDLLHWEPALVLAKKLSPDEIPYISREYAQQQEFKGEYKSALELYSKGFIGQPESKQDKLCGGGVARTSFRVGDTQKGMNMALQMNDKALYRECAAILEGMKQFNEAAAMYDKGQQYDKAATIYLKTKNYLAIGPLMEKITSPNLHKQFALVMEDAERAYELGKDSDNVVRLNLEKLNNPEKAFDIARKARTPASARLIAKFCLKNSDPKGAIEFLLGAKLVDEGFELAQKYNEIVKFAEMLGENGTVQNYEAIAQYYEKMVDLLTAGHYYSVCGQFQKALRLFLSMGDKAIDQAIEVIGKAKSDALTRQLIDFLMGDTDGIPKDPQYIYRFHMSLKNYEQAAPSAIIIARQEQELGNYKVAHSILFTTYKDLESFNIKLPFELKNNLMLLHSYIVAKILVRFKDHNSGARMLMRVSNNITRFPCHDVSILTSTVVECMRSGLKRSAFNFAAILVRPEYKNSLDPAYKKKIEAIVRKSDKAEEEELTMPCPNCNVELANSELECLSCKSYLPYCIITGRHMVIDDWSHCPCCNFPALYSFFSQYVTVETTCPMCEQQIDPSLVVLDQDAPQQLKRLLSL